MYPVISFHLGKKRCCNFELRDKIFPHYKPDGSKLTFSIQFHPFHFPQKTTLALCGSTVNQTIKDQQRSFVVEFLAELTQIPAYSGLSFIKATTV